MRIASIARGLLLASVGFACPRAARADEPLAPAVRATLEAGTESPELRALREFEERELVPSLAEEAAHPEITSTLDTSFLAGAELPDLPARWDDAVVRYLLFFRDDPRGRSLMRAWYARSRLYDESIRETLRGVGAPEDLRCVALAESGFDPRARSPVGAVGMWQFIDPTAREYGLTHDAWVDERMDVERSTVAAARYLNQLRRRFGTWELALSAYNMGYGALLRAMRKYNTNDFAVLARMEAGLPFETTVYVAKIVACGVVLRNPERFGLETAEATSNGALSVEVPAGFALAELASLAEVPVERLTELNPQLLRGIAPLTSDRARVRVPASAASRVTAALAGRSAPYRRERARFGETLASFASRFGVEEAELRRINALGAQERPSFPLTLAVPRAATERVVTRTGPRPTVAVIDASPAAAGRRRLYHSVVEGDDLSHIAEFYGSTVEDIVRGNALDPRALLQPGMVLRVDADGDTPLADCVALREADVQVVVAGTEEFFDHQERLRGRLRVRYRVQTGDTLGGVAQRFGLTLGDLARINRLGRDALLRAGQVLVVYAAPDLARQFGEAP